MDLASYAQLAVTLVNSGDPAEPDGLTNLDGLRALLVDRPDLSSRATRSDVDVLRELRAELREVFGAACAGDEQGTVERLNTLLVQHPIHPQISGHDGQPWHMHLTEGGSVSHRYAVGAVMGLATLVTDIGVDRLGTCQATPCSRVYIDTSSNRSRRYCSDRCASRANVAAYRARQREPSLGTPPTLDNGQ